MYLIDTHYHLDFYANHQEWYARINEMEQYTLCVTNSPEIFHSCRKLYKETKFLKFALGYNPQIVGGIPLSKSLFSSEMNNTAYLGEVGLDFSKPFISTKQQQIQAFDFICKEASKNGKLLSVHSRMAEQPVFEILQKNGVRKAIVHWYTGSLDTISDFVDAGYYFSINANMCVTEKGKTIIGNIPPSRILIESDGPFTKVNARKYTPLYLDDIYKTVSDTTGVANLKNLVWENFKTLLEL